MNLNAMTCWRLYSGCLTGLTHYVQLKEAETLKFSWYTCYFKVFSSNPALKSCWEKLIFHLKLCQVDIVQNAKNDLFL